MDELTEPGAEAYPRPEYNFDPLVSLAASGDAGAFEEIVRAMQGRIRAFTRRTMRDDQLGDDAAQEAFLRAWKGLGGYKPSGKFVPWMFTIAHNTCVEMGRKRSRFPLVSIGDAGPERPDYVTDSREIALVVRTAVDSLSPALKETLLLQEAGLSYHEIADTLRCPVGTVRSRLSEARKQLARLLAGLYEEV